MTDTSQRDQWYAEHGLLTLEDAFNQDVEVKMPGFRNPGLARKKSSNQQTGLRKKNYWRDLKKARKDLS